MKTLKQLITVVIIAAAGAFLLACPYFISFYWLRVLSNIFMFAIITQGINIIAGYTGYPAFGNVVFFGLGAYTTGVLMTRYHAPFWATILAGIVVCALYTLIFGVPLLRLKGHYFAIATLGLNEATRAIIDNLTDLTGGGMGMSLPLRPGDIADNSRYFYYILFGTMVACLLFTFVFTRLRFGYACHSIRADEEAADCMGINSTYYKTLAWMVSAVFTGIAGSVYAYWMTYIEPSVVFDMAIAVKSFVMFLIGGAATLFGPIIGAFFMEVVSTIAWSNLLNYHIGAMGVIIIIVVLFIPAGFVSFFRQQLAVIPALLRNPSGRTS